MGLPPGLDGNGLLALSAQGLATMFERELRKARGVGEGVSWNVTGYEEGQGSGAILGKALFAAVRREALASDQRRNASVRSKDGTRLSTASPSASVYAGA